MLNRENHGMPQGFTTRAMAPRATTYREEDRSVEFTISTEVPARVFDWDRWEVIDEVLLQSGMELPENKQVPLLDSHDRSTVARVLGSMREFTRGTGKTVARAYFSKKPQAVEAAQDVRDGHITDCSVGYIVRESVWIPEGQKQIIENKEFYGPMRVSTRWSLRENSLVAVGADIGAKSRSAQILENSSSGAIRAENHQEEPTMENPNPVTPVTPPAPAPDLEAVRAEAQKREQERCLEIRKACKAGNCEDLIDDLIQRGVTADEARKQIIERMAKASVPMTGARVEMGQEDGEKFRAAAVDAILVRTNSGLIKTPAAGHDQLRRLGFEGLARECLRRAGVNTAMLGREQIFRLALARALPSHSTSDFNNILGSTAGKAAMLGWQYAVSTWRLWCRKGSLSDFKSAKRVRLGDAPSLLQVPESGEVKMGTMADSGESIALVTYARNLSITRHALINDDLSIFDTLFRAFGARATDLVNSLPYAVLAANANLSDSVALFSTAATRKNLASSGGAISNDTIAAGKAAMKEQTAPGGTKLNISPAFLLTGSAYENAAQLNTSQFLSGAQVPSGTPNPHRTLTPVSDSNIAGNAWFLVGDPSMFDTVEVAFLDGVEEPTVTEAETVDILGRTYTCFIDATAKALDFRALYKNAGA